MQSVRTLSVILAAVLFLSACSSQKSSSVACDPDNGGLTLPEGFCATVIADSTGRARHIAVAENGDIYVAMNNTALGGGILALRDTTGDGKPDIRQVFGRYRGTEIRLRGNWLYFSTDTLVMRYAMRPGQLVPDTNYQTVVAGFEPQGPHSSKSFTFDEAGNIYVQVGSTSDACGGQEGADVTVGQDPCKALERHASVWRFKADGTNQMQLDGERFVTGTRNIVGIAYNTQAKKVYAMQHGRDMLSQNFPKLFTDQQNADMPAEELFVLEQGKNYGWPYCMYDLAQKKKVLMPEYGGDGKKVGPCDTMEKPVMALPAHWSPNDLIFYTGNQFPEKYRNGALIAFHGSWNRSPFGQQGFNVVFVPFANGRPSGNFEVFAKGFAGAERIESVGDAKARPTGLAMGPDGSLYVTDGVKGKIWRVMYRGE